MPPKMFGGRPKFTITLMEVLTVAMQQRPLLFKAGFLPLGAWQGVKIADQYILDPTSRDVKNGFQFLVSNLYLLLLYPFARQAVR